MKRRPEPELMDEAEQALAYAQADFSEPDARFIELLAGQAPGSLDGARALDLGCGPGNVLLRFLRAYPKATCDALDGSAAMLAHAQAALDGLPGLAARARLLCECLPTERLEARRLRSWSCPTACCTTCTTRRSCGRPSAGWPGPGP